MSKPSHNRRLALFRRYSENLEPVKTHPSVRFDPDFSDSYICPLCFEPFQERDLDQTLANPLTLEHVPPESLGGKPVLLTCKICNSTHGHQLDTALEALLRKSDVLAFLPRSSAQIEISAGGGRMSSKLTVTDQGELSVSVQRQNSNPVLAEKLCAVLSNPPRTYRAPDPLSDHLTNTVTTEFPITFHFRRSPDERKGDLALLRIAYLLAFQKFGHAWLLNGPLHRVREQLQRPNETLLSGAQRINFEFPDEHLGVNIIKHPKELQCFLVVFDVTTSSRKQRFAIALPGPSSPGIDVYDNIQQLLYGREGSVDIKLEYPGDADFVGEKNLSFASHVLWQKHTA